MDFQTQFKAARRVSAPLIAVRTFDAESATEQIKNALGSNLEKTPMLRWDSVHGIRAITKRGDAVLPELLFDGAELAVTEVPLEALRRAEKLVSADVILIFCNSHLVWQEHIQAIANLRDVFAANGRILVLLCSPGSNLPAELVNDFLVMDEPLPTANELNALVASEYDNASKTVNRKLEPDAETLSKATDALIGLPAFPARQSTAMCLSTTANDGKGSLDLTELWERKRQVVSQTPGCSIYKGSETLADVRGLDSVVNFLRKRMSGKNPPKCILFQDEVEKAFAGTGTDMSGVKTELTGSYCTWFEQEQAEGITFIGLPGVSKSNLAKALGNEYGIPTIIFDIAATQNSLVGQSGANLRTAQKMVSSISQGRLLVISTCNGIESVPPEIRRRIGSLGIFFFDAPATDECLNIFELYRGKYNIPETDKLPNFAGWTGAEIKECCRKADVFGMSLEESAAYIVPVTRSSADRIKALRMSSSGKYLSASHPGVYQYSETQEQTSTTTAPVATGRKFREESN